jgi:hypothetical protein
MISDVAEQLAYFMEHLLRTDISGIEYHQARNQLAEKD